MTLILSYANRDCVLQVSDRRLTIRQPNGTYVVEDDEANKAIVVCNRAAFAYTGLACVRDQRTDYWIVDALSAAKARTISDAWDALGSSAAETFAGLPDPVEHKRIAFAGVGWLLPKDDQVFKPVICRISNAIGEDNKWLPQATAGFTLRYQVLNMAEPFIADYSGYGLATERWTTPRRLLKRCTDHNVGPATIAGILASIILNTARTVPTVGQSLNIVSIPRPEVVGAARIFMVNGTPNLKGIKFCSWPLGVTQYAPHWVCGELKALDAVARYL